MEDTQSQSHSLTAKDGLKIGFLVGVFGGALVGTLEAIGVFITVFNAVLPSVPEAKETASLLAGLAFIIFMYSLGSAIGMAVVGGIMTALRVWRFKDLTPQAATRRLAATFTFGYSFLYIVDRLGLQELQSTNRITALISLVVITGLAVLLGWLISRMINWRYPEPERPAERGVRTPNWKKYRNLALAILGLTLSLPLLYSAVRNIQDRSAPAARPGISAATGDRPNIILLTIDALRADRIGAYGYENARTPNIDRLAAEGVLFEQANSQAPWTFPSFASMLTSMYPSELNLSIGNMHISEMYSRRVDDARVTLPEALQASGYTTQAVVTNPWLNPEFGFAQGFDGFLSVDEPRIYHPKNVENILLMKMGSKVPLAGILLNRGYLFITGNPGEPLVWDVRADRVTEEAVKWIRSNEKTPFFLWIHYIDPHFPFDPPEGYRPTIEGVSEERLSYLSSYNEEDVYTGRARLRPEDITALRALYDGEIAYTDIFVGQLLDEIDALGLRENTVLILTSDHGDEFWDHGGYQHGHSLYDELIHIPFIIRGPGEFAEPRVMENYVQHLDLMPTVLEIIGREKPPEAQGRSLLPLLRDPENFDGDQPARNFAEALFLTEEKKAIRTDGYKLIYSPFSKTYELYDLNSDPGEQNNLAPENPALVTDLGAAINAWLLDARERGLNLPLANTEAEFDPGAINRLREGGY